MAELSLKDKKAIFGPDYEEPAVTPESRAAEAAERGRSRRKAAIALGLLAILGLAAIWYGGGY